MEKRYLIQVQKNGIWRDYGSTDLNDKIIIQQVEEEVFNCQGVHLIDTYTGEVIE